MPEKTIEEKIRNVITQYGQLTSGYKDKKKLLPGQDTFISALQYDDLSSAIHQLIKEELEKRLPDEREITQLILDTKMNEQTPYTLDILILDAFISIWLSKTRTEIEFLCKDNKILKDEMLKSQLSIPLEAWHNIKNKVQIKTVDIEDCTILGYSWQELKRIKDYITQMGFDPRTDRHY